VRVNLARGRQVGLAHGALSGSAPLGMDFPAVHVLDGEGVLTVAGKMSDAYL
jgi:hypothetical protein